MLRQHCGGPLHSSNLNLCAFTKTTLCSEKQCNWDYSKFHDLFQLETNIHSLTLLHRNITELKRSYFFQRIITPPLNNTMQHGEIGLVYSFILWCLVTFSFTLITSMGELPVALLVSYSLRPFAIINDIWVEPPSIVVACFSWLGTIAAVASLSRRYLKFLNYFFRLNFSIINSNGFFWRFIKTGCIFKAD